MIEIQKAQIKFNKFLEKYNNKDDLGFELKVIHTYHVVQNALEISKKLKLSEED